MKAVVPHRLETFLQATGQLFEPIVNWCNLQITLEQGWPY